MQDGCSHCIHLTCYSMTGLSQHGGTWTPWILIGERQVALFEIQLFIIRNSFCKPVNLHCLITHSQKGIQNSINQSNVIGILICFTLGWAQTTVVVVVGVVAQDCNMLKLARGKPVEFESVGPDWQLDIQENPNTHVIWVSWIFGKFNLKNGLTRELIMLVQLILRRAK